MKTARFKEPKYVGDPINAVRIFNEKQADELMVLDIDASVKRLEPDFEMIEKLAKECRMPLCYGGGIKTRVQADRIIKLGVEKIALSSVVFEEPSLVTEIGRKIGLQSVVAVLDLKKNIFSNRYSVWTHNATVNTKYDIVEAINIVQSLGVGEIVLNFIDRDGMQTGYLLEVVQTLSEIVSVPLTILGGAGSLEDLKVAVEKCGLLGLAAGSLFVFKGAYRAVLISYPERDVKEKFIYGK